MDTASPSGQDTLGTGRTARLIGGVRTLLENTVERCSPIVAACIQCSTTGRLLPGNDPVWRGTRVRLRSRREAFSRVPPQAAEQPNVKRQVKFKKATLVFASLPGADCLLCEADRSIVLPDTTVYIAAGTIARTFAQAFIHPLDTIKTRLQVPSPPPQLLYWQQIVTLSSTWFINLGRRSLHLPNYFLMGPRDIYLGLSGAIIGTLPTACIYFGMYERSKAFLEERLGWERYLPASHLISATVGAMSSAVVRVPTDMLRHRVQAYFYPNILAAAGGIFMGEGPLGFYRGFAATLMRDVPEIVIQFTVYDQLRHLVQSLGIQAPPTVQHLVLGGMAGATAACFTMPLDVLKTTLQCGAKVPAHKAFANILKNKGVSGLFAGLGPRLVQTTIMSAVFFAGFEIVKQMLQQLEWTIPEEKILSLDLVPTQSWPQPAHTFIELQSFLEPLAA